jgi:hypothetical protein
MPGTGKSWREGAPRSCPVASPAHLRHWAYAWGRGAAPRRLYPHYGVRWAGTEPGEPEFHDCGYGVQCPVRRQFGHRRRGEHFTPATIIVLGDTPLETTYGSDRLLTARVPAALYGRPGSYPVYLRDSTGESSRLEFVVRE